MGSPRLAKNSRRKWKITCVSPQGARLCGLAPNHYAKQTPFRFAATPILAQPVARTIGPTETTRPSSCATKHDSPTSGSTTVSSHAATRELRPTSCEPAAPRKTTAPGIRPRAYRAVRGWLKNGGCRASEIKLTHADVSAKAPVRPTCSQSFARGITSEKNEKAVTQQND